MTPQARKPIKIYEVRDISCDETYYTKGYFETLEEAIKHVDEDFKDKLGGICEFSDEYRIAVVIEIEVGKWDNETGFNKEVYRKECSAFDYDDDEQSTLHKEDVKKEEV